MGLTFVVGSVSDVFSGDLARSVGQQLLDRFPSVGRDGEDPYRSEPVAAFGWRELQGRVLRGAEAAPQLTTVDAYQAVYVPEPHEGIEHVAVPNLADPLQVGSLPELLEELRRFAVGASLPTDDVELMELAAHYLEAEDEKKDLDVQTYAQLMLSAKQAIARNQPLWIVV